VDIDPVTLNIDPDAIEFALAQSRRIRAILPVHVFGQPADMDPILDLAHRHGVPVIEDACEALGAAYKGRAAGGLGNAGVFAFYPNKQITTGEGGMVVTDDSAWDALFRSLRNQGRDADDGWLSHTRLGYNYRLDELSAALGLAQTARLDELLEKRARVAAWYQARLGGLEGIRIPVVARTTTCMSWFVYVVRLPNRDHVLHELARRGIPSRPYFPPIHLQPFYQTAFGFRGGEFPHAESAGASCLALPFFGTMREDQVDAVCGALEEIVRETGPRVRLVAGAAR
jgi:dTDP-4-amino-4,6-dideoxygalactose transaminase